MFIFYVLFGFWLLSLVIFRAWIFDPIGWKMRCLQLWSCSTGASLQKIACGPKLWRGPWYSLLDKYKLENFWWMFSFLFSWWGDPLLDWRWQIKSIGIAQIGTIMHSVVLWWEAFHERTSRSFSQVKWLNKSPWNNYVNAILAFNI